jgi:hypothetical protein
MPDEDVNLRPSRPPTEAGRSVTDELARIAARHAAASPGPWRYERHDWSPQIVHPADDRFPTAHCYGTNPADAEFIVHAWEDVRTLLDEVARLRVAVLALETGS